MNLTQKIVALETALSHTNTFTIPVEQADIVSDNITKPLKAVITALRVEQQKQLKKDLAKQKREQNKKAKEGAK